jgi:hypothetical protein
MANRTELLQTNRELIGPEWAFFVSVLAIALE